MLNCHLFVSKISTGYSNKKLNFYKCDLPTTGSKTACVACSSPIGVLNQIRFNLFAMGESSVDATENKRKYWLLLIVYVHNVIGYNGYGSELKTIVFVVLKNNVLFFPQNLITTFDVPRIKRI